MAFPSHGPPSSPEPAPPDLLASISADLSGFICGCIRHADGRGSVPDISAGVRELVGLTPEEARADPARIEPALQFRLRRRTTAGIYR